MVPGPDVGVALPPPPVAPIPAAGMAPPSPPDLPPPRHPGESGGGGPGGPGQSTGARLEPPPRLEPLEEPPPRNVQVRREGQDPQSREGRGPSPTGSRTGSEMSAEERDRRLRLWREFPPNTPLPPVPPKAPHPHPRREGSETGPAHLAAVREGHRGAGSRAGETAEEALPKPQRLSEERSVCLARFGAAHAASGRLGGLGPSKAAARRD